ncbi:MAG TPA: malto-oligosyltrehalose trehalohydrolase [Trebonia sp.]|nr:malto-oligosyltrehalose trehalohydrolase [Trebonia sp.]
MTAVTVWAPTATRVDVEIAGRAYPMRPAADAPVRQGWWRADVDVPPGTDYAFRLDGGEPLADPRSPWQPSGPSGPSRTYDHSAFAWTDQGWRGAPLPGAVVYETHVGTFTPEGTLDAAIGRLDYLASLGVTAVELMPLAAFPGEHGWGYDGICLWAVHDPYGGPDALKRFVDACHSRNLAVILDVVYNHVGPGNRLASFGPYFTSAHMTPWGPAVNLDQAGSDEVRAFVVGNALMWVRDYHIDALRLDAVHALEDHRAMHVLEQLAVAADAFAASAGRSITLIAESDLNDPRLISAREAGGYGLTAQWNDDFHHAVHSAMTGERQGYYGDFGSLSAIAKTLTGAYFYNGTWSSFRGRTHGRPVDVLKIPAYRFVCFVQDHDQVGNRAIGDRIAAALRAAPAAPGVDGVDGVDGGRAEGLLRVAAGLVLTAPFTPMLFMGEEWGADTPWQFFTDHTDPGLAAAVSEGRRSEFAAHGWGRAEIPDPQDKETFLRSKLDWTQQDGEPYRSLLSWYRSLIALRRARPELTDPRLDQVRADYDEQARWLLITRGPLRVAANLGTAPAKIPVPPAGPPLKLLLASTKDINPKSGAIHLPPASFAVVSG